MTTKLLFIDTETTGLLDNDLSLTHPDQPHIVQVAAELCSLDAGAVETLHSLNFTIVPLDWDIPPEATAVHGITPEYAHSFGVPAEYALGKVAVLLSEADPSDPSSLLIAHNQLFDYRMLLREFFAHSIDHTALTLLRPFCTMRALTPRMKLPGRYPGQYKWPRLAEAYRYCFGRDFDNAHTAMGDVLACKAIYFHGREKEWW